MSEDFQNKNVQPAVAMQNVQSQSGFWRRIKHYQDKLVFESSTGGKFEMTIESLWQTAEQNDAKLIPPTN